MISPSELASVIVTEFDPRRSVGLVTLLAEVLRRQGVGRFESEEVAERVKHKVSEILARRNPQDLPFYFADAEPDRLVGKQRPSQEDPTRVRQARQRLSFLPCVLQTIHELEWESFEVLCAECLRLSGAHEAFATCSGDDGGIDIYGRIILRPPDQDVPVGLIHTTLLDQNILLLGQCKRYDPGFKVGPSDIHQFQGALDDCLKKYQGNPSPPSHRVPYEYYEPNERCIPVFMTTATYSDRAIGLARAAQVIVIEGPQVSQFIAWQGLGFDKVQNRFEPDLLRSWLSTAESDTRRHA